MRIIYYILGIILLVACSGNNENAISGNFKNYDPSNGVKEVYLFQLNQFGNTPIDTAYVQENGEFHFPAEKLTAQVYGIGTSSRNNILVYVDSNKSQLKVQNIEFQEWTKNYEIVGNQETKTIAEFDQELNNIVEIKENFSKKMSSLGFNDTAEFKKLNKEFQTEVDKFLNYRDNYINENKTNPALTIAVYQIDPQNEFDLLKEVVADIGKIFPNSNYHKSLQQYVSQIEIKIAKDNLLKPGTDAPDLNFPDVNGNYLALSSLKGNIVLIDFWASWCRPCRAENPNVVSLYNKYSKKGFEIYSFSLDNNKQKWVEAIAADGLIWKSHVSDLKGWQTAAIPIYNFNSIPFTVLIDREGNVIAKNLRGEQLKNKLAELFNS